MALRLPDLSHVLVADLPRGRLGSSRSDARLVALPAAWLDALIDRHPGAAEDLAAVLAPALIDDARAALEGTTDATAEDVGYAVSVALATRGLGLAAFERWGDALVFVWKDSPVRSPAFGNLAAAVSARVVGALTGLEVHGAVVSTGEDVGSVLRVLLASPQVCELARDTAARGGTLGAVLEQLTAGDLA